MQNTFKYYEVCKYTVYETKTHSSFTPTMKNPFLIQHVVAHHHLHHLHHQDPGCCFDFKLR